MPSIGEEKKSLAPGGFELGTSRLRGRHFSYFATTTAPKFCRFVFYAPKVLSIDLSGKALVQLIVLQPLNWIRVLDQPFQILDKSFVLLLDGLLQHGVGGVDAVTLDLHVAAKLVEQCPEQDDAVA